MNPTLGDDPDPPATARTFPRPTASRGPRGRRDGAPHEARAGDGRGGGAGHGLRIPTQTRGALPRARDAGDGGGAREGHPREGPRAEPTYPFVASARCQRRAVHREGLPRDGRARADPQDHHAADGQRHRDLRRPEALPRREVRQAHPLSDRESQLSDRVQSRRHGGERARAQHPTIDQVDLAEGQQLRRGAPRRPRSTSTMSIISPTSRRPISCAMCRRASECSRP